MAVGSCRLSTTNCEWDASSTSPWPRPQGPGLWGSPTGSRHGGIPSAPPADGRGSAPSRNFPAKPAAARTGVPTPAAVPGAAWLDPSWYKPTASLHCPHVHIPYCLSKKYHRQFKSLFVMAQTHTHPAPPSPLLLQLANHEDCNNSSRSSIVFLPDSMSQIYKLQQRWCLLLIPCSLTTDYLPTVVDSRAVLRA